MSVFQRDAQRTISMTSYMYISLHIRTDHLANIAIQICNAVISISAVYSILSKISQMSFIRHFKKNNDRIKNYIKLQCLFKPFVTNCISRL